MELPKGFKTKEGDGRTHVLQILRNLYGHNQAGRVWTHNHNDTLQAIGIKQSAIDEYVWYKDTIITFYYVNDGIFMRQDPRAIYKAIKEI